MITKLRIKNFKCLADTGDMEIKPLTFLMGPNSSGKTSLLQILLMIRQTVESADTVNPFVTTGPYTTQGSFWDFIYGHEEKGRSLTFEVYVELPRPVLARPLASLRRPNLPERISSLELKAEFIYDARGKRILPSDVTIVFPEWETALNKKRSRGTSYSISLSRPEPEGTVKTRATGLSRFFEMPTSAEFKLAEFMFYGSAIRQVLRRVFGALEYLGPLREEPQRVYVATGETTRDVGTRGERAIEVLWSAKRSKAQQDKLLLNKIDQWIRKFGVAKKLEVDYSDRSGTYEAWVEDLNTLVKHINLKDVGFGISQILPVIIKGFLTPPFSTLLLEQPEIHLHPRAQAGMGDLLIDIAQTGKSLIVETHSEHLIARIQRRIAEGSLRKDDVIIYYFQPSPEGTQVLPIPLNDLGQFEIDKFPEGFFDEGYIESFKYAEAIAKKVQSQQE